MARPARLVKLEKGKIIDVHEGFVDTFNYLVDYIQNLCGEGNLDPAGAVWIDRNRADHPVIRLNVNKLPQGGGGGKEYIAGNDTNIVFTDIESGPNIGKTSIDVYYI